MRPSPPTCQCDECPKRGQPMTLHRETVSAWVFVCSTCYNVRAMSKAMLGGTIGSGEKEDGCRGVWSVGR